MGMSDDELTSFYFRDGLAPGDAERIEREIAADPALAARYQALVKDLARLRDVDETPAPAAAIQRWRAALDVAARPAPSRQPPILRFAAMAAVVVVAIGLAFLGAREQPDTTTTTSMASLTDGRTERALLWHLVELETQLGLASEQPAAERAGTLRRLAEQNRLQTTLTERAGGAREARVLRAFTVTLDDMAAEPEANTDYRGALAQLNFEMKVMQARLASSSPSTGARRLQAL